MWSIWLDMFCHTRAGAWVKVRLCLLLQVGLLKCTFPSGSIIALVGLDSELGVGLLNGHLLVGLLTGGGGVAPIHPCRRGMQ